MIIYKDQYIQLCAFASTQSTEIGCLLGSKNGNLIDTVVFDYGIKNSRISYTPDIAFLNHVLADWNGNNIFFRGILHTHLYEDGTLSDFDKTYIDTIMSAMPKKISSLFFPVFVVPKFTIYSFIAKNSEPVRILSDCFSVQNYRGKE